MRHPVRHGRTRLRLPAAPSGAAAGATLLAGAGCAAAFAAVHSLRFDPLAASFVRVAVTVAVVLSAAVAAAGVARPAGRGWPWLAVGVLAAGVLALLTGVLHGSPWGLYGLYGDQQFRTQQITHYASTAALNDFAYPSLPAFYPWAFPWILGRLAAATGTPAWQTVHPWQLVMAPVIVAVTYLAWSRVVAPASAALVTVGVTLLASNPYKPDEWIALAVIVPWWMEAFRETRRPGVRRWGFGWYGVIGALILYSYTFYFTPLAVTTVLGWAVDAARRRPQLLAVLRRNVAVAAVVAVASAGFWLPLVLYLLAGHPFHNTQFFFADPSTGRFPVTLDTRLATGLLVVGVGYVIVAARRSRLAETVGVLIVGAYAYYAIGFLLADEGHPILVFKAAIYLDYVGVAAGVLALAAGARWLAARRWVSARGLRRVAVRALAGALAAVLAAGAGDRFVHRWAVGAPILAAQGSELPGGGFPRPAVADEVFQPVGAAVATTGSGVAGQARVSGPPAAAVYRALGGRRGGHPVVVSARDDVVALYPVHPFLEWAADYSNPFSRYDARAAFLARLAATRSPAAFTRLARHNPFEAIDAFVLVDVHGALSMFFAVEHFPRPLSLVTLHFRAAAFAGGAWRATRVGDVLVERYRG